MKVKLKEDKTQTKKGKTKIIAHKGEVFNVVREQKKLYILKNDYDSFGFSICKNKVEIIEYQL
ncbi:hypothetical protein [uncultured Mediterranean phage uvMED]|nr:hypothetical protein [uncultured Mediterranean phage uvMED]